MDSLPTEEEEEEEVSGSARTRTEEEEAEEVRRDEARAGRAATAATEQAGDDDGPAAIARAVGAALFENSACVCFWIRFYSHVSAVIAPLLRMRDAEESKGARGGSMRGDKEKENNNGGSRAERASQAGDFLLLFLSSVGDSATRRRPFARRARSQRTSGRASRLAGDRDEEEEWRFG